MILLQQLIILMFRYVWYIQFLKENFKTSALDNDNRQLPTNNHITYLTYMHLHHVTEYSQHLHHETEYYH